MGSTPSPSVGELGGEAAGDAGGTGVEETGAVEVKAGQQPAACHVAQKGGDPHAAREAASQGWAGHAHAHVYMHRWERNRSREGHGRGRGRSGIEERERLLVEDAVDRGLELMRLRVVHDVYPW